MHDYISNIFEMIRDLCKYTSELSVDLDTLKKRVITRGYTEDQLNETISNYISLNLLMNEGKTVTLIDG